MTPDEQAKAARDLLDAERTGNQIGLLTLRYPEMTMDDAYQIQNAIYRTKLDAGRRASRHGPRGDGRSLSDRASSRGASLAKYSQAAEAFRRSGAKITAVH